MEISRSSRGSQLTIIHFDYDLATLDGIDILLPCLFHEYASFQTYRTLIGFFLLVEQIRQYLLRG